MTKYIKDKSGKFAGSIGDGNKDIPTPQDEAIIMSRRNSVEEIESPDYDAILDQMRTRIEELETETVSLSETVADLDEKLQNASTMSTDKQKLRDKVELLVKGNLSGDLENFQVATDPLLNVEDKKILFDKVPPSNDTVWKGLASRNDLTPEEVELVLAHSNPNVRKSLALGYTTITVYKDNGYSYNKIGNYTMGRRNKTPQDPKILQRLVSDADEEVRNLAYSHPNAPQELVEEGVNNSNPTTRAFMAEWSRNLTSSHFSQLVADSDPRVRARVAQRSELSKINIEKLISDPDLRVRLGVLDNYTLTGSQLSQLVQDPEKTVRIKAVRRSNLLEKDIVHAVRDKEPKVIASLLRAHGENMSPDMRNEAAERLAINGDSEDLKVVAQYTTNPTLLQGLGKHSNEEIRNNAKNNSAYPAPSLLRRLFN